MLVHLDTSLLVDAFTGPRRSLPAVLKATDGGDLLTYATPVLYEWLRGPRGEEDRDAVERFFSGTALATLGEREARTAAALYRAVGRARHRQADIAIAACAIEHGAALWTLNRDDFTDLPGLSLYPATRG